MVQLWEVVGGADKGGILVRTGQDLNSPQEPIRLSTGSVVVEQELASASGRLRYAIHSGTGPREGWVSVKLKDKDLLVKIESTKPEASATQSSEASLGPDLEEAAANEEPLSALKSDPQETNGKETNMDKEPLSQEADTMRSEPELQPEREVQAGATDKAEEEKGLEIACEEPEKKESEKEAQMKEEEERLAKETDEKEAHKNMEHEGRSAKQAEEHGQQTREACKAKEGEETKNPDEDQKQVQNEVQLDAEEGQRGEKNQGDPEAGGLTKQNRRCISRKCSKFRGFYF